MLDDLSPRKQAFVKAYLANLDAGNVGRGSIVDAVQAAGISPDNRNAARVRAHEMMRDPQVLSALHNEQIRKLNAGSALGVAVLIDLARNAKSEPVRLQAAAQLVDRSPLGPVPSRSMSLHANVSVEDLLEQLDGRGAGPGMVAAEAVCASPRGHLATDDRVAAVVIDAEFREVVPLSERWADQADLAQQEAPVED